LDVTDRLERNRIIRGLLAELDLHGPGERIHAERVAVYSVSVGARMGMIESDLLALRYAAELHDVGKIQVSASLLRKMGRLSEEDLDELRSHARRGADLLAQYEWLDESVSMIRHHHERWDGAGYPAGLMGTLIPLGSRIIAVAEAFDVMVFGGWGMRRTEEEALLELRTQAGAQFDPSVVEAFEAIQPLVQPVSV